MFRAKDEGSPGVSTTGTILKAIYISKYHYISDTSLFGTAKVQQKLKLTKVFYKKILLSNQRPLALCASKFLNYIKIHY